MTDYKVIKPVATTLTGTSSTIGSFPPPVPVGQPVGVSISPIGASFVTFTNQGGTLGVTVAQDQTAAPVPLPVGIYINSIYRSTLPTYANGQASILHTDARGRLYTASIDINAGNVTSVDQDAQPATVNPVGTYVLGIYRLTLPTYLDGQAVAPEMSVNGEALVSQRASTSAVTSVASSAATVSLLVVNLARKGATVYNDSTNNLYLKLGAAASLTSFTVKIGPGGYYEIPNPIYTGAIDGIWNAAAGFARITELSA